MRRPPLLLPLALASWACAVPNPAYEACQANPAACAPLERCDGEDQDLDGQVDEGLDAPCAVALPGYFKGDVGFGRALAAVPDLDGDGFEEVLVSSAPAPAALNGEGAQAGAVFLLRSQSSEQRWAQSRPNAFGAQLAAVDLNGDGAVELVASMPLGDDESAAGLFVLSVGGELVSRVRAEDPSGRAGFGRALGVGRAPTGEVALLTSEPSWEPPDGSAPGAGRVLGFTFAQDLTPQLAFSYAGQAGQRLGERLVGVPDVDGDGVEDIMTTAWAQRAGGAGGAGGEGGEERQVWVLSSATGRGLRRFSAPEQTFGTLGDALAVAPLGGAGEGGGGAALVFSAPRALSPEGEERGRLFVLTPDGESLGGAARPDEFGGSLLPLRAGGRDLLAVGARGRIYLLNDRLELAASLALDGDEVPTLAAAGRPDPDGRTRLWVGLPALGRLYTLEVR